LRLDESPRFGSDIDGPVQEQEVTIEEHVKTILKGEID
jgi:hypothetical protein